MNIRQIFENNYIDPPIVDTRLTPKCTQKHPKETLSNLGSHMGN